MFSHGVSQFLATLLLSSSLVQGTPLTDVEEATGAVKPFKVGSTITFRASTKHYKHFYLAHTGDDVNIQKFSSSNTTAQKQTAMWKVQTANNASSPGCVSFESVDTPGSFIRHFDFELYINPSDGSEQFDEDSTFCPATGFIKHGTTSIQAINYPTRYFRHFQEVGYIASDGGPNAFDTAKHFTHDASFYISSGFKM